MENNPDELREQLLRGLPLNPDRLAAHRQEVVRLLDTNERKLRRAKWYVGLMWCYLIVLTTIFMVLAGWKLDSPVGVYFGISAVYWLVFGVAFLIPHFVDRSRVEVIKELKGIELQLFDLRLRLDARDASQRPERA